MIIGMHEVKITTENRGEHGIYGIVYARNVYYPNTKLEKIGVLAPGMKLSKELFYSMLKLSKII